MHVHTKITTHIRLHQLTHSSESYKKRSSLPSVVKIYTTAVARTIISIQPLLSEVMKFQLVVTVLLVGRMLGPSLAAPLREDEKANVVLQAIRLIVGAEHPDRHHGEPVLTAEHPDCHHGELQQAENVTSAPSGQLSGATSNG